MSATVSRSLNVASASAALRSRMSTFEAPSRIFSATAPFAMLKTKSAIAAPLFPSMQENTRQARAIGAAWRVRMKQRRELGADRRLRPQQDPDSRVRGERVGDG